MKFAVATVAEKNPDHGSWMIMLGLGYAGSHIILIKPNTRRIYHADGRFVCENDYDEQMEKAAIIDYCEFEVPITEDDFQDWWGRWKDTPYTSSQFPGFGLSWTRYLKKLFKNGRKGAICTEFVSWFMYDVVKKEEFADNEFGKVQETFEMVKKATR